jgi:putative spermidine/putrescine transport system substrate-binding protein
MRKSGQARCAIAMGAVAAVFGVAAHAGAAELTVVNFGGANGDAQKAAFNQPFEAKSGAKVTAVEYNGEQAKVKAMVEAKHVNWDVVEVESGDLGRGCDEGLYEKLDWSKIGKKSDLIPELGGLLGREEDSRQARHAQRRAL